MRMIAMIVMLVQAVLAARSLARMARTANGTRIRRGTSAAAYHGQVTVLVPVLNERARLEPCLTGLVAQGPEVAEILVIDGGSTDGTQTLVRQWAQCRRRVRLIDAAPVPEDGNGKAHGLQVGLDQVSAASAWILTIDADVRPDPLLVRSLLAHAAAEDIRALSAATQQRLSGAAEGVVHPAMLGTLVYRFGIPGHATRNVNLVQANGQCFLVRRELLERAGGFAGASDSVCEDVTTARAIAAMGERVGFYETDNLVAVEMYDGLRDAWVNWSRSLPMRDRYAGRAGRLGLAEVLLAQALPLWLAPLYVWRLGTRHPASVLNVGLVCMRIGVLVGMARAYVSLPWTCWLSPVADLAVALRLLQMWRRRRHVWRGRVLLSGGAA